MMMMEPRAARGSVKDGQTGRRALHQLALLGVRVAWCVFSHQGAAAANGHLFY